MQRIPGKPKIERVRAKPESGRSRSSHSGPAPDDERVGYRRPPKQHRFKPGQSGNPKGRPKPHKSVIAIFDELLSRRIRIKVGGKIKLVPMIEAFAMTMINRGLKGGMKEITTLLQIASLSERKKEAMRSTMPVWKEGMSLHETQAAYADLLEYMRDEGRKKEAAAEFRKSILEFPAFTNNWMEPDG